MQAIDRKGKSTLNSVDPQPSGSSSPQQQQQLQFPITLPSNKQATSSRSTVGGGGGTSSSQQQIHMNFVLPLTPQFIDSTSITLANNNQNTDSSSPVGVTRIGGNINSIFTNKDKLVGLLSGLPNN